MLATAQLRFAACSGGAAISPAYSRRHCRSTRSGAIRKQVCIANNHFVARKQNDPFGIHPLAGSRAHCEAPLFEMTIPRLLA
jgi:hypothetical protein